MKKSIENGRGNRLRVLVGTVEIAGMIPVFADGFRRLGYQVTTAIRTSHPFYGNIDYDVEIESGGRLARSLRLLRLIAEHDVFFFQWGGDSLRWQTDLPLLRLLGKRIVYALMGDDVRSAYAYQQQAATFYKPEQQSFILSPDHQERLEQGSLEEPLRYLRNAEWYSDLILSVPCNSSLALRPYDHLFVPLNLTEYHGEVPGREVPIVLHAPSHQGVKGTELILSTLDRLKLEGLPFDLRFIHQKPHREVLSELKAADIVIDQLFFPLHGKFAVEAMATGCAVATSNREDFEPFPRNRPLWHIDPGNIYSKLRKLLTNRELRLKLAHESRDYVERYHDHAKVAGRIMDRLTGDDNRPYDHYPTFFAEQLRLPKGVTLPSDLARLSAKIAQRWGLPAGASTEDMIGRGLIAQDALEPEKPLPRWRQPAASPTI